MRNYKNTHTQIQQFQKKQKKKPEFYSSWKDVIRVMILQTKYLKMYVKWEKLTKVSKHNIPFRGKQIVLIN